MIKCGGKEADLKNLKEKYPKEGIEAGILDTLSKSSRIYDYSSQEELLFETEMRMGIIRASKELYRRRLGFETFHNSTCNEEYWSRREDGGFVLKKGVKASAGIRDIYRNTREYATECATAIVIIFYAAVLEAYSERLFDQAFSELTLMNWMDMDELMGISTYRKPEDYLSGDCRYFRNPDVNPLTPEWQGENTIDLGNGEYYGHGIGIGSKERIIRVLNENRIEDAQASAYLMETATRPNFINLYQYKKHADIPGMTTVPAVGLPVAEQPAIPPAAVAAASAASIPAAAQQTTVGPSIVPATAIPTGSAGSAGSTAP